jgi:glycosyl transferase, family 25
MESTYTFAIGHPRFAERYVHIKGQLEQIVGDKYTILGIDGRALSESETAASRGREGISLGQLGCALSHLEAYKRMIALGLPHGFVVEDDAVLPQNLNEIIQEVLPYLPRDGVISFFSPRPALSLYSIRDAPVTRFGSVVSPVGTLNIHTTTAYLISAEAAKKIIRCNFPVRHLADHWWAFRENGGLGRVHLLVPMPCGIKHFESLIGYGSGGETGVGIAQKLKRIGIIERVRRVRRKMILRRQMKNIILVNEPSIYEKEDPCE